MVSIPTSSGTGSEVTPFAIITDADTGTKWPIADYELLPNMAIIDVDNMMDQPKGLTSSSGIDALTHALEAYASIMATDFTDGMALQATKLVFDYLIRDCFADPSRYLNFRNTVFALLNYGVVPIVNENDTVAVSFWKALTVSLAITFCPMAA